MKKLRALAVYFSIFIIGGLLYGTIEIGFRGRTHWSMLITGGLCAIALYLIAAKSRAAAWKKWLVAGAVITTAEFYAGVIVNILLGWEVWDYSSLSFNLFGQICPHFSLLWILLSIPVIKAFQVLEEKVISRGGYRV